jgi:hypothetical protein
MVSVASTGGRRMRVVPPVPVPALSRTVPGRMLAALLARVWRAGSVSVLLGGAALVWLIGTLLSPANTTHTALAPATASPSSAVVRTVANVAGGPGGGGGDSAPHVAPKPASSSSSGSSANSASAPKPAAKPASSPSSGSSANSSAAPKPAKPAPSAAPPNTGAPKPVKPGPGAVTAQSTCGATGGPCGAAPKAGVPVADNSAVPQITGAPKPAKPATGSATAVCGPGCDRSVLGVIAHNETAGPAGGSGDSATSCGPNGSGCPAPAPATPAAPGSGAPAGPSNAGAGGAGGPGHAGGTGAARLTGSGSTDPSTAQLVTGGLRQSALDPNQSPNTARGPPTSDPTASPNSLTHLFAPGVPAGVDQAPLTRLFNPTTSGAAAATSATEPSGQQPPWATLLRPVPGEHAGAADEPRAPGSQQLAGPHKPSEQMQLGRGQPGPNPAMFRSVTGHDPVTPQDWRTAATLDPSFGEPGVQSIIGAAKITPKPGDGQVYGDAFIQDHDVLGLPPHMEHLGDNRGFDPSVDPDKSRVSFMVDYDNGLAIVRQNPTHATDGAAGVHPAQVGVEQDPTGSVRLRLKATNGLIGEGFGDLGESVRGDFIVDPNGGPHGIPSVNGKVTQFPSWEAYSSRMGQPPTTVLQRQQNPGGLFGPAVNLPLPSVDVGQQPQIRDQWLSRYHRDQADLAQARSSGPPVPPYNVARPLLMDPSFNDYPMPALPAPAPDGHGGVVIPQAGQVR